jgi:ABC-type branched-subunit amino acid transport system ATPase component
MFECYTSTSGFPRLETERQGVCQSYQNVRLYEQLALINSLLDPSCSGSGIVNRLDYLLAEQETQDETDAKAERLEKLASFQLQMIQHAFKCASHYSAVTDFSFRSQEDRLLDMFHPLRRR